jgi:hypothetical protein
LGTGCLGSALTLIFIYLKGRGFALTLTFIYLKGHGFALTLIFIYLKGHGFALTLTFIYLKGHGFALTLILRFYERSRLCPKKKHNYSTNLLIIAAVDKLRFVKIHIFFGPLG